MCDMHIENVPKMCFVSSPISTNYYQCANLNKSHHKVVLGGQHVSWVSGTHKTWDLLGNGCS